MLNSLDIALLCDSRTVDGAGLAITPSAKGGIHAQLGDGATAGTMPTPDALNGKLTFDGGDYMVLRQADDVDGVLADMGSIQDETYILYMNPYVIAQSEFVSTNNGVNPRLLIRTIAGAFNRFEMQFLDAGGAAEFTLAPNNTIEEFNGKSAVMAFVRRIAGATAEHDIFMNGVRRWGSVGLTARDASSAKSPYIGSTPLIASLFAAGTGLRFFGYSRTAWTAVQLRALQRYLRGNL